MTRYAHYVGSLPADLMTGDQAVLQWFADRTAGSPVTALPCDLDPDWIIDYLRTRKQHSDVFEIVEEGGFADYSDFPSYGLRSGRKLETQHVSMDRVERIDAVVAAFESLQRERPELAETRVQISLPNPLDLAMFTFAGAAVSGGLPVGKALRHSDLTVAALRQLPVFAEAMVQEVSEVVARHGDRISWQLESPLALLSMVKATQLGSRWALAPLVARQLASVLGRLHEIGAETTVHLCYGDYQHKSLLAPRSLAPAVGLLNRTARLLDRQGTPLPPVHIPCAYGAEPAPLEPRFYAPLRSLATDWPVIAGVVSADSVENSDRARALFEQALGRHAFGVATACGLGRCTPEVARIAAEATVAVARDDEQTPD
ncbi:hypothetical protein ACQP2U_30500 [Nocardia sp. CA-084685]|uniref:hypothetical protein n=1 Tax=Nocardia sp. CA-084685 TaxID=3239970 RepID=UPI003D9889AF